MIRLLFPEINFSGRLNRAGFWRELAIAAFTTPILIGLLTYIVNEFSVAAAQGLAVDDASAKVLAGLVLTGIGVRNTIAFWSIVKRRMNDIAYGPLDLWRDSRMLVIAAVLAVLTMTGIPIGGFSVILFVALMWILFLQASKVFRFGWLLMASPSVNGRSASSPHHRLAGNGPDLQPARWLGQDANGQAMMRLFTAISSEIGKFSKDGKAPASWAEVKSAAARVPALAKLDGIRQWLDQPVVNSTVSETARVETRPPPRVKTVFKTPLKRAVMLARSEPRRGRSSLLSGLLRGPWG